MLLDCSTLLQPGAVSLDVSVPDRDTAIRYATGLLKNDPAVLDLEGFTKAVLARERLHSTALPVGVAFPHTRKSVVQNVVLSALRLKPAVSFEGVMVHLIFVIGSPANRTADHLSVLAWLAKKMADAALLNQLLNVETPEGFCELLAAPTS